MTCSMEDYLSVVSPHLSPALVSPEALSRLRLLSQTLPSFSLAGFESRLGAEQPVVDLLVRFPRLVLNLPEEFLTYTPWQALQNFCQEWVEPTSFIHQKVQHIWLEFDLDRQPLPVPIPCLFLSLNSDAVTDRRSLLEMARKLPNQSISPAIESNLKLCAESLPPGATIQHLGAMLSRPGKAVRLVVRGIPAQQIPDYLAKIGWSDPTYTLKFLISALTKFVDFIGILDLDVGETIAPKIGLECFINKQSNYESRLQSFLDYLVNNSFCTPTKRDALLSWPGYSQKKADTGTWPNNLSFGDRFLGARAYSIFWRSISHIKISYQPGTFPEVKGYLAFGHNWFDSSPLRNEETRQVASNLKIASRE